MKSTLAATARHPAWLPLALAALLAAVPTGGRAETAISAQGLFTSIPGRAVSPAGTYRMDYTLVAAAGNRLLAEITVVEEASPTPRRWRLHAIPGPALFVSDTGRIVSLESFDPPEIPATLRVYDLEGRELHAERLRGATDPRLSPDGARLVCRTVDGVVDVDLASFARTRHPLYSLFAPGPGGRLAGATSGGWLQVHDPGAAPIAVAIAADATRLEWTGDGAAVLVLTPGRLLRIDARTLASEVLFSAAAGEELRDLRVRAGGAIEIALRATSADRCAGSRVALTPDGRLLERSEGPAMALDFSPRPADADGRAPSIPWPLAPNSQHPVGNTYNEYQNYGGEPYPHPGIDVFGSAGQHVFAVHAGVVKAVLSTGGDLYWRVAVADTIGSGTLPGYLYAHLVYSSIAVTVGQQIQVGQYLGDLVDWPVTGFTHTHFARISDTGAQWHGSWLSIGNPHPDLENQSDDSPPVFEPASGSALLAFCANETSNYQNPNALHGAVDIIAHVGDRILSTYVCTVQELRYTIYPVGHPEYPLVDDKLAVLFDMSNDYYAGGSGYALLTDILYKQDGVCRTQGDYDYREFYHILTNSDGNQHWGPEDLMQCWDTSALPDGQYRIRVTARDVAGNTATDSMTVQTANGNPSSAGDEATRADLRQVRPNPSVGPTAIRFSLASAGRVSLGIYDPSGRRVRSLLDAQVPAGPHEIVWDGRDESGRGATRGIYLWRLSGAAGARSGRIVIAR
jgi:murein DD-endopeptidase MepM/ murein hydrolase activator NlpD